MKLVKEIEFHAKTESEAFNRVKARLGSDGVILSMQTVKEPSLIPFFKKKRLFVRAGILEEEKKTLPPSDPEFEKRQQAVFQALLNYKSGLKAELDKKKASVEDLADSVTDTVDVRSRDKDEDKDEVHAEGVSLSRQPEAGSRPETIGYEKGYPRILLEQDVPSECVDALWNEYLESGREESFPDWFRAKASEFCVPHGGDALRDALGGRRVMVVGPTGVGKTTTIAKIAAMAVMEGRKTALFTSDNYRVSAVEQIRTFARVLGLPLEVVNEGVEIPELLEKYDEDTLILMDTVGCGFRETGRLSQVRDIWEHFSPHSVHIAISGTSRLRDIQASVEKTRETIPLSRAIVTKLDETLCAGTALWLPMALGLPLSFLATGQNVPRDIDLATGDSLSKSLLGEGALL
jgi:flagellar biosynthesis protein FlhF